MAHRLGTGLGENLAPHSPASQSQQHAGQCSAYLPTVLSPPRDPQAQAKKLEQREGPFGLARARIELRSPGSQLPCSNLPDSTPHPDLVQMFQGDTLHRIIRGVLWGVHLPPHTAHSSPCLLGRDSHEGHKLRFLCPLAFQISPVLGDAVEHWGSRMSLNKDQNWMGDPMSYRKDIYCAPIWEIRDLSCLTLPRPRVSGTGIPGIAQTRSVRPCVLKSLQSQDETMGHFHWEGGYSLARLWGI